MHERWKICFHINIFVVFSHLVQTWTLEDQQYLLFHCYSVTLLWVMIRGNFLNNFAEQLFFNKVAWAHWEWVKKKSICIIKISCVPCISPGCLLTEKSCPLCHQPIGRMWQQYLSHLFFNMIGRLSKMWYRLALRIT